ncbi:Zinc finger, C2H2 type family protein [Candida albicans]|uniref:Zinc finger, C2H2 type family protein n=1 Tax=Candida albicans TaxID=5476 RepID=A0A8H6BVY6_CANAX|nr:Zinc finger, C2H2 type family protein [Candida albicans]
MSNSPNPNNPNNHNLNKSPNNLPNNKFTNMSFSQVQTTLPPQFTEYPQQAFVQQTYQQQQQQQHLQAQQAFQQHQQLQLLMQQSGQHQHQYQPQPQQQQQQQPFPSTQLPVLQQQQVYAQPVNQSENYYIQAPRGYGYSSSLSSNTSNASQQPQVYNTSPLSATYVHENAQYVVPSVDTVRGFPTRGGIVPKRGRKRRHTATVHNMTPETAERNRCRICNKQFKRPSSLQTHYYSHTGEKIFKCPWDGCGRLFSVKSNMTRHYRLHEPSHAPTTALQQQEPFNTNNQNLGSSDSAAKSQYPSYLSSSNLPTTDNNPSI